MFRNSSNSNNWQPCDITWIILKDNICRFITSTLEKHLSNSFFSFSFSSYLYLARDLDTGDRSQFTTSSVHVLVPISSLIKSVKHLCILLPLPATCSQGALLRIPSPVALPASPLSFPEVYRTDYVMCV